MTVASRARSLAASAVMASTVVVTMADPALAQAAGIETVLQNIVDLLTGNIARLLAIIAVILICIAWMFSFMDLRRVGYWILGVGGIFGAAELVNLIVGS